MEKQQKRYKLDLWQKLHLFVGNRIIGPTHLLEERSGISLSWDFMLPRKSIMLQADLITEGQMQKRVAENDFRRKLTLSVAILFTAINLIFVNLALFGAPAFFSYIGKTYTEVVQKRKYNAIKSKAEEARVEKLAGKADACTVLYSVECKNQLLNELGIMQTELDNAFKGESPETTQFGQALFASLNHLLSLDQEQRQALVSANETTISNLPTNDAKREEIRNIVNNTVLLLTKKEKVDLFFEATAISTKGKTTQLTDEEKLRYATIQQYLKSN